MATGPDDPPRKPYDGAEAVMDALADFEAETETWTMTTKRDPEWRRKTIKRRLRAIKRNPASATTGEVQRLTAEYKCLVSAERAPAPVAPVTGLTEQVAAAVATWPIELRNRLDDAALNRVISPWGPG